MKKYIFPIITFQSVTAEDIIVTSINIEEGYADDSPVLSNERDEFFNNWEVN